MQAGLFCGVRSLPGDIQRLVPKPSQTVLTDGLVIDAVGWQVDRCVCLSVPVVVAVASCYDGCADVRL